MTCGETVLRTHHTKDDDMTTTTTCPHYGEFGHVHPGPSYDRKPCACGEPFRSNQPPAMHRIGHITACIDGDYRYTTEIEVWCSTHKVEIRKSGCAPIGGMDGPGGTHETPSRVLATFEHPIDPAHGNTRCALVPAVAAGWCMKELRRLFKEVDAGTVARYGKPTRNFRWHVPSDDLGDVWLEGFNLRLADAAIRAIVENIPGAWR